MAGLLFALNQTWSEFGQIKKDMAAIEAEKTNLATKTQVEVIDQRLRRWIDRVEVNEETSAVDSLEEAGFPASEPPK